MQGPIVSIGVEMIGPRNVQVEIMPVTSARCLSN